MIKICSIVFLLLLAATKATQAQPANPKSFSLESIIELALEKSPDVVKIENAFINAEADAYETERLSNPSAEINATASGGDTSQRVEIELEQPMRLSHFGARRSYADALRHSAIINKRAQTLELIHSITRYYAAYWALQEQVALLSENVAYARKKQNLIERAAQRGRVDVTDAQIFKAEALRLEEQLRVFRAKKQKGASNLLKLAGIDQQSIEVLQPISHDLPALQDLMDLPNKETSIVGLLEKRKALAEKRYRVAKQDARFPEFTPRTVINQNLDEDETTLLFGVNITIPIWDKNNAELSRAKAERSLAHSHLNKLKGENFSSVLATALEVAQASNASAYAYRNKIIPAWIEVQSLTDKKFDNGQASILDLLQIRERVTDVKSEALQVYLNAIEAQIALEALIGRRLANLGK